MYRFQGRDGCPLWGISHPVEVWSSLGERRKDDTLPVNLKTETIGHQREQCQCVKITDTYGREG